MYTYKVSILIKTFMVRLKKKREKFFLNVLDFSQFLGSRLSRLNLTVLSGTTKTLAVPLALGCLVQWLFTAVSNNLPQLTCPPVIPSSMSHTTGSIVYFSWPLGYRIYLTQKEWPSQGTLCCSPPPCEPGMMQLWAPHVCTHPHTDRPPDGIPALCRARSGLHHCSSCLLCLTVHGWHWWPHSWPSLLRHARRTRGHAAHISRKGSVLHPSWWHSSQGHSTTRLAWPLSMHLAVGIDAHAGPWAAVACTGHPTICWGSGVVT